MTDFSDSRVVAGNKGYPLRIMLRGGGEGGGLFGGGYSPDFQTNLGFFGFISWKGVKFHCNTGRKGTETVTGGGQHILDSFLLPVYSSCFFYFIQSVISTQFAVKIVDLDSGGFPRGLFLFSSP